ncbi:MAG: VCBS repeat-containing protein [Verrucomicrobia bacterium]|nr:VCBS repeat-containing protein [Verrucomicrobiota bacterium]
MKTKLIVRTLALAAMLLSTLNPQLSTLFAQGTAFTYQGRLTDGTNVANGAYDFRFRLFDALTNGTFSGGVIMLPAVGVSNGLFTVTLAFNNQFLDGSARWLDIGVRTNGSPDAYLNLVPRQPITATPYAITAGNVTGAIADSQLSGNMARLNSNAVFTGAVVFSNAASQFAGSFAGNGAGVTNMNLTLNSSGVITSNSSFFTLFAIPNADYAASVVAADVNGDGRIDLICPTAISTYSQVLTNDGHGGFALASAPGGAGHPGYVAVADINGDGSPDLISADSAPNKLTISTNNGHGIFTQITNIVAGSGPVVAADVNNDGRIDLISADYGSSTLTVVFNNSPNGFLVASSPAVGLNPTSLVAADVNGDGKVDLITANSGTNTLSVMTNTGFGFFVLASSPNVGSSPFYVTAADVNGDSKMDLITANYFSNTLSVLTNNGIGGFVLASSLAVGSNPVSVVSADVNGDGKADLICANSGNGSGNTLSVLTNNGSGGFTLATSPVLAASPTGPSFVAAADVNGDGRVDLIASRGFGALSIFLNTPFSFLGNFNGHLSGSMDGSTINTGTIDDARLSDQVALLNKSQNFDFPKTFSYDVGIGTTTPVTRLDARSGSTSSQAQILAANNNANTWVQLWSGYNNGANPPAIIWPIGQMLRFISSTVSGSGGAEFMRIDSAGNVGIGRAAAVNKLEVEGNASKTVAGSWLANSDARIKQDIQPVHSALDTLAKVRPVSFRYTDDYRAQHRSVEDRRYLNVVAQEFRKVFPDDVKSSGEKLPDGSEILQVDSYPLTIYSVAAIQELNQKLETELKEQHAENAALKARLEELERRMSQKNGGAK